MKAIRCLLVLGFAAIFVLGMLGCQSSVLPNESHSEAPLMTQDENNEIPSQTAGSDSPEAFFEQSPIWVSEGEHVVFVSDNKLYAIMGENTDDLFGDVDTVEKPFDSDHEGDPIMMTAVDGPQLVEEDVKQALVFASGTTEWYYGGEHFASLLYIKNDGSLWVRGSNRGGMFGSGERLDGIKILDDAVSVYCGTHSVSALKENGEYYRWDYKAVNDGGIPTLISDNVAVGSNNDLLFLTTDKKLCCGNGKETVVIADGVTGFSSDGIHVSAVFEDGTAKQYNMDIYELEKGRFVFNETEFVHDDVSCAGSGGAVSFVLKNDGTLYGSFVGEWNVMKQLMTNVRSAAAVGGSLFAISENGGLYYIDYDRVSGNPTDTALIANDVIACSPIGGNDDCLYVTADGDLHYHSSVLEPVDYVIE